MLAQSEIAETSVRRWQTVAKGSGVAEYGKRQRRCRFVLSAARKDEKRFLFRSRWLGPHVRMDRLGVRVVRHVSHGRQTAHPRSPHPSPTVPLVSNRQVVLLWAPCRRCPTPSSHSLQP